MDRFLERFSLSAVVAFSVGAVLFVSLTMLVIFQISWEHSEIEDSAVRQASAALDMLESVHSSAMLMRSQTADNDPAIDTLNMSMGQFAEQSKNIKLWVVMAQRVLDYQLANNQTEIEGPQDDIDSRALLERASQQEFTENEFFRLTRPVVLGVGSANNTRCGECHTGLMGIANGEVIGAYSAEVNMAAPLANWRAGAINIIVAGILITLFVLFIIVFLLRFTVLNPVIKLASAAEKLRKNERTLVQAKETAEFALNELYSHKLALDEHAIVAVTDTKGTITYANDKFCKISGYDREELIGQNHRLLNSGHHPEEFFADMYRGTTNGQSWHGEIKNRAKDGSHYWVDSTITPFKDAGGQVVEFIAIRTDITKRKRAEHELVAHRDHLQVLVDAATKDLKTKAEELTRALGKEQELNKLQREFVSMASHEFRTPLAIIDSSAQRMKSRADKGRLTSEDAIQRVRKIRDAVGRMTRLMESTLDAVRMEEGKIKVEIGECDIRGVILEALTNQIELTPSHNITCDLQELPIGIQGDADILNQVFTNLLTNAVKYAPDAPDIKVEGRTEGSQVVISVRDQGMGIDEDEIDRIGERFFRARTSTGIEGTGIGLNLVMNLVRLHGGSFGVESIKGEGSTFTVRLPIAGQDQTEQINTRVA